MILAIICYLVLINGFVCVAATLIGVFLELFTGMGEKIFTDKFLFYFFVSIFLSMISLPVYAYNTFFGLSPSFEKFHALFRNIDKRISKRLTRLADEIPKTRILNRIYRKIFS